MTLAELIQQRSDAFVPMFDPPLDSDNTIAIDLSTTNREFDGLSKLEWDQAIEAKIAGAGAIAAVGGYLEKRSVYESTPNFEGEADRNIHIGVDVFVPAGTAIHAPLAGEICCFANRQGVGDYGPVIILRHELGGECFHSLYGHLTEASLHELEADQPISAGAKIAEVGDRPQNGDWPPHLHFQLIRDLQGLDDNYPGVAHARDLEFYRENCPDPNSLIVT